MAYRRTKGQREKDRETMAMLYMKGYTFRQMADQLKEINRKTDPKYTISHQQVFKDVKAIVKDWEQNRQEFLDKRITIELEKINRLERVYNEAWEESKQTRTKRRIKTKGNDPNNQTNAERMAEEMEVVGDKRWLEGIQWCVEMRLKLLGIEKQEVTGNTPTEREGTINMDGIIYHI